MVGLIKTDEIRDVGKATKKAYSHTMTEAQGPHNEEVRRFHVSYMILNNQSKLPFILLGLYALVFLVLAIAPVDRATWFVENLTIWIIVGVLVALYVRGIRFSNTAYVMMSVLIFLHTVGGHYTFEKVPFDWVTNFFGFERNHYDRIAHFSVGFYAYPIAEWLLAKRLVANKFLLFTYPVFVIATIAMSYEIIEWIYAANSDPLAGAAYLGSQGDIWDAQKDMLADTLGALVAATFFLRCTPGKIETNAVS